MTQEQKRENLISACCGSPLIPNIDRCSLCKEDCAVEALDDKKEVSNDDFSTCDDLVQDDQDGYERDRYESQTEDRSSYWGGY